MNAWISVLAASCVSDLSIGRSWRLKVREDSFLFQQRLVLVQRFTLSYAAWFLTARAS